MRQRARGRVRGGREEGGEEMVRKKYRRNEGENSRSKHETNQ